MRSYLPYGHPTVAEFERVVTEPRPETVRLGAGTLRALADDAADGFLFA